jgi:hypothetical protein
VKHERVSVVVLVAGVIVAALACRQDPGVEPKTPPNTPIPKIDRPEGDPVTPTSAPLPVRDAG